MRILSTNVVNNGLLITLPGSRLVAMESRGNRKERGLAVLGLGPRSTGYEGAKFSNHETRDLPLCTRKKFFSLFMEENFRSCALAVGPPHRSPVWLSGCTLKTFTTPLKLHRVVAKIARTWNGLVRVQQITYVNSKPRLSISRFTYLFSAKFHEFLPQKSCLKQRATTAVLAQEN